MASYCLTDAALDDLDRLCGYGILAFGLIQADKYYDGLVSDFQTIAGSPLSFSQVGARVDNDFSPGLSPFSVDI